jgi:hypothetical protein
MMASGTYSHPRVSPCRTGGGSIRRISFTVGTLATGTLSSVDEHVLHVLVTR